MERLPNIHPGEVLREEFLIPLGISQYQLAKAVGCAGGPYFRDLRG
jgi:antitoxin HigA-1